VSLEPSGYRQVTVQVERADFVSFPPKDVARAARRRHPLQDVVGGRKEPLVYLWDAMHEQGQVPILLG
jgi:hypothetical protein